MRLLVDHVGPFVPESPWEAELTDESAASSYGRPVLRVWKDGEPVGDFGPGDVLMLNALTPRHIGNLVRAWAGAPERTAEERDVARAFLGQEG